MSLLRFFFHQIPNIVEALQECVAMDYCFTSGFSRVSTARKRKNWECESLLSYLLTSWPWANEHLQTSAFSPVKWVYQYFLLMRLWELNSIIGVNYLAQCLDLGWCPVIVSHSYYCWSWYWLFFFSRRKKGPLAAQSILQSWHTTWLRCLSCMEKVALAWETRVLSQSLQRETNTDPPSLLPPPFPSLSSSLPPIFLQKATIL